MLWSKTSLNIISHADVPELIETERYSKRMRDTHTQRDRQKETQRYTETDKRRRRLREIERDRQREKLGEHSVRQGVLYTVCIRNREDSVPRRGILGLGATRSSCAVRRT